MDEATIDELRTFHPGDVLAILGIPFTVESRAAIESKVHDLHPAVPRMTRIVLDWQPQPGETS